MNKIKTFWETGKTEKAFIIVSGVLVMICLCFIVLFAIGMISESTPSYKATQTALVAITQTFNAMPTNTLPPSNTPQPTNILPPSNTPQPSNTPIPSNTAIPSSTNTRTPIPSPTKDMSLHLSLEEFVNHYDSLTDLQKKAYITSVIGKIVRWDGQVLDVNSNGDVTINIPGTLLSVVYLQGVPLDIAQSINKDSHISFTGTIEQVIDFLGLHIYLSNVTISQ
jgi:hypothetical protein